MRLRQTSPKKRLEFDEKVLARIVGDAAIATVGVGHGRLIPLLILDSTHRPDIAELIRVHEHITPGDVRAQWARIVGRDATVALILRFQRPVESDVVLDFDIVHQGGIVDQILAARALYIQAGRPGDRLLTNFDKPRILVEVGDTGFGPIWDRLLERFTVKDFRDRGLSKPQAKEAARAFITEWREFSRLRMKQDSPQSASHEV